MAGKVTAGRDVLGDFAPKFAELNDDVLFGQVWSREERLSTRDRTIVTVGFEQFWNESFDRLDVYVQGLKQEKQEG